MTDAEVVAEIRWSLEHTERTELSVRLPRAAWASLIWHVERPDGPPPGEDPETKKARKALERAKRELAAVTEERDALRERVARYVERHEKDRRLISEARAVADETRAKRRGRPGRAEALAAGTRIDGGEDPVELAREYGWSSAAVMADAICAARRER